MKIYKNKTVKTVDRIHCDVCGQNCTQDQLGHEYGLIEADWGYASKQDGVGYEIHVCEHCFMNTIKFLRNQRQLYMSEPNHDPFNGKGYLS